MDKPYWEQPEYLEAKAQREQAKLIHWFNRGRCPDCHGHKIIGGPRGGVCQNVACGDCERRFNVASYKGRVFFVERIGDPPPPLQ